LGQDWDEPGEGTVKFHPNANLSKFSFRNGATKVVVVAAAIMAAAVVAFARLPLAARDVIWAEDGGVFLRDAMAGRGMIGIFSPYDGYLHVVPRIAAIVVVRLFRIDDYALAMNFLSCVVIAAIAMLVYHCSKAITPNRFVRICWASITILVAPAPLESLGNFANIHSYFLWLTPWLILKPAQSKLEGFVLFTVAALASLTEIVAALFLPLFAVRFKVPAVWPARSGLLAGLVVQAVVTVAHPRSNSETYPPDPGSIVIGWFLNSSSAIVYGNSARINSGIQSFGPWPVVLAVIPFILAFVYILLKGTKKQRLFGVILLLSSTTIWSITQVVNFRDYFDYSSFDSGRWQSFFLSRYSTVPSMFLMALLPLMARCDRSRLRMAAATSLLVFVALQCLYFFPQTTGRSGGPDWKSGVATARDACNADPSRVFAPVEVAPGEWLKGGLPLSCALLRSSNNAQAVESRQVACCPTATANSSGIYSRAECYRS
jgi:hypothetical protein